MSEHTPGPWVGMDENGKFNPDHSWSFDNENACVSQCAPIFADGRVIAFVVYSSDVYYKYPHPSIKANARLIAAAPDLYKTLEEIAEWTERYTTPGHPIATVARAALAKTEGEE